MESVSKYIRQFLRERTINGEGARKGFEVASQKIKADPEIRKFINQHQSQLADDAADRSIAKLREYVMVRDAEKNDQASFVPGYTPQLIVSDHLIDVTYKPTEELLAKRKAVRMARRVTTLSMPKDILNASLDDFEQSDGRFAALTMAVKFSDQYPSRKQFMPGCYLYGPFGVGKTYLLGAVANDLAKSGVLTTLIHFPSFESEMKASIGDNSYLKKIDSVKKSQVLMLDDIGANTLSTWVRDEVLGVILEYRMQQQLPMFFSSNISMEKLADSWLTFTNRGEGEPLKAQRLMQRIRFLSREVKLTGSDRRPKK